MNASDYIVTVDVDGLYRAWRAWMTDNSEAQHFGVLDDSATLSGFPGATLRVIGRPTAASDLENTEATVDLTVQVDCYITGKKLTALYAMDDAAAAFFQSRGFHRIGDAQPIKQSETVTRLTSRFTFNNFNGTF